MGERGWKGIPLDTLAEAGVHVSLDGLVTIPYRRPDGRLHTVRVFTLDGRCWWRTRGVGLIPFGLETITYDLDGALLIVEGESDALTVRAYHRELAKLLGVRDVQVIGLPGARSWRRAWENFLPAGPSGGVFVLGDGDQAGQAMNTRVLADMPDAVPVWNIGEGYDVRQLVQSHGVNALAEAILDAHSSHRYWRLLMELGAEAALSNQRKVA